VVQLPGHAQAVPASKAPINGILIAVSIADLIGRLTRSSHHAGQEPAARAGDSPRAGSFRPVVVFTKADLITGFADFFEDTRMRGA
jgi:type VI secretion system protein ImpL